MKLNFKYYNTGSLIVLILVLSVIFIILKEIFNSFIEIPTDLLERLKTLNDYLVFSIKGVVNAKYAVPDDLFKKLEKRKLSLKKRIILQWLKIKNSKLPK